MKWSIKLYEYDFITDLTPPPKESYSTTTWCVLSVNVSSNLKGGGAWIILKVLRIRRFDSQSHVRRSVVVTFYIFIIFCLNFTALYFYISCFNSNFSLLNLWIKQYYIIDSINMFSLGFNLFWPYIALEKNLVFLFEKLNVIEQLPVT